MNWSISYVFFRYLHTKQTWVFFSTKAAKCRMNDFKRTKKCFEWFKTIVFFLFEWCHTKQTFFSFETNFLVVDQFLVATAANNQSSFLRTFFSFWPDTNALKNASAVFEKSQINTFWKMTKALQKFKSCRSNRKYFWNFPQFFKSEYFWFHFWLLYCIKNILKFINTLFVKHSMLRLIKIKILVYVVDICYFKSVIFKNIQCLYVCSVCTQRCLWAIPFFVLLFLFLFLNFLFYYFYGHFGIQSCKKCKMSKKCFSKIYILSHIFASIYFIEKYFIIKWLSLHLSRICNQIVLKQFHYFWLLFVIIFNIFLLRKQFK